MSGGEATTGLELVVCLDVQKVDGAEHTRAGPGPIKPEPPAWDRSRTVTVTGDRAAASAVALVCGSAALPVPAPRERFGLLRIAPTRLARPCGPGCDCCESSWSCSAGTQALSARVLIFCDRQRHRSPLACCGAASGWLGLFPAFWHTRSFHWSRKLRPPAGAVAFPPAFAEKSPSMEPANIMHQSSILDPRSSIIRPCCDSCTVITSYPTPPTTAASWSASWSASSLALAEPGYR